MTVSLEDLPYATDALAPHVSKETLNFHFGKHHKAYVDKTNSMIEGTKLERASLEDIVFEAEGTDQTLFNNAAQAWNHAFYWKSMRPDGGGRPSGALRGLIDKSFGSYKAFAKEFADAGAGLFGSGWVWLVHVKGDLEIRKTSNAETPLTSDVTPLLNMDVWEHAYYLDYQNARAKYVDAFLENLVNWEFAEENLMR
jgi:Fe-Mn family superoxide dismutase